MSEDQKEIADELSRTKWDTLSLLLTQIQSAFTYISQSESIENIKYISKILSESLGDPIEKTTVRNKENKLIATGNLRPLLMMLMTYLQDSGAKNYVEMIFTEQDGTDNQIVLTIQRVKGLTPGQKVEALEFKVAELTEEVEQLETELLLAGERENPLN